MASRNSDDDTAKPGFVSAVVMKFTKLAINDSNYSQNSKLKTPPIKKILSPNLSKNEISRSPLPINDRIQVEYEVIGDVSVKDRIKAFTSLTQTVNKAVKKPDVLNSSKFASPVSQTHVKNNKAFNNDNDVYNKAKIDDVFNESAKVSEIASKFSQKYETKIETKKLENKKIETKKLENKKIETKSIDKNDRPQLKSPFLSFDKKLSSKKSQSIESISKSTDSSDVPTKFEYDLFEIHKENNLISPSHSESDIINELMESHGKDNEEYEVSKKLTVSSVSSLSKDVETKKYILIDHSKDPNYTILPKCYNVKHDSDGKLQITLPPSPKLSNMKKKSKTNSHISFNTTNITIMETYNMYEYERGDSTIDPLTASAEYEIEKKTEALDKFNVQVVKDEKGLGMSIVGIGLGSDVGSEKLGIYIKALTPGGASHNSKKFQIHDQLLEVNGISLVGVTQAFAAQTLKSTSKIVNFLVGREKQSSTPL